MELGERNSRGALPRGGRRRVALGFLPGLMGIEAVQRAVLGLEESQAASPAKALLARFAHSDGRERRVIDAVAIHDGSYSPLRSKEYIIIRFKMH
jgi:hypothetical protein